MPYCNSKATATTSTASSGYRKTASAPPTRSASTAWGPPGWKRWKPLGRPHLGTQRPPLGQRRSRHPGRSTPHPDRSTGPGLFRRVRHPAAHRHRFRHPTAEHAAGRAGKTRRFPPGRQGRLSEHHRRTAGGRPGLRPGRGSRRLVFGPGHPAGRKDLLCRRSRTLGEIRPVTRIEQRIGEAQRLGFDIVFVSAYNQVRPAAWPAIRVIPIERIEQLIKFCFA